MDIGLDKKFGYFIVDFANAENTEDAILACLRNFQQNFQFSPDFYEMTKNLFPSLNVISVLLDNNDKKLLKHIFIKNDAINSLNEQLRPIKYMIENYDPLTRSVSLMSLDWGRDSKGDLSGNDQIGPDEPGSSGFLQTLKLLGLSIVDGPVNIKIDVISGEIAALLGPQAADQLHRLLEIGHVLEELISDSNEDRYRELHLLAEEHREVIDFHKAIEEIQINCRQILDMEIAGKSLKEIPALAAFIDTYNKSGAHQLRIAESNRLAAEFPINERKHLTIKGIEGWLDVLRTDTAYCMIEVLKSEKSRKRLKKCRTCSQYFIARQPHIQKFCTRQCRMGQSRDQLTEISVDRQ